jgi:hypothetical protein
VRPRRRGGRKQAQSKGERHVYSHHDFAFYCEWRARATLNM